MTLESDILTIMLQHTKIRPSEIRVKLLGLPDYKNHDRRGLDVNIVGVLDKLVREKSAKKQTVRHGCVYYSLTEKGTKHAQLTIVHEKAKVDPQATLEVLVSQILKPTLRGKDIHDLSDWKTLEILDKIQPEGKAFVDMYFWLDAENQGKIDVVIKNLQKEIDLSVDRSLIPNIQRLASGFAEAFKRALADAKNLWYEWEGPRNGPLQMQKLVELVRESLNFDAMVMFHFNGKQIVANIDWDKYKAQYEKPDREEEEKYERFRKGMNKKGDARKAWIRVNILKKAREAQDNFGQKVLSKTFRHLDYKEIFDFEEGEWKLMLSPSNSESLLINEFAQPKLSPRIRKEMSEAGIGLVPDPPSIDECKEAFASLQKEGAIEIVPAYFYKVNRKNENRVFWRDVEKVHEETGYTLT